jgi:hypothetical protein
VVNSHSPGHKEFWVFHLETWSYLLIGIYFYTNDLPALVCETFTDLNDPAREHPVHKTFMANFPDDTNQGIPSQGDSCDFPFFGNVGVPLMSTLNILGLNV